MSVSYEERTAGLSLTQKTPVDGVDKTKEEGTEKQGQDEENLKEESASYEIRTSDRVGRHLVTSDDLTEGQMVLRTLPLATGPLPPKVSQGPAPCLSCYCLLNLEEGIHVCNNCGWPLCSEQCSSHPRHLPECLATASTGVMVSFTNPSCWDSLYDCIIILRCLSLRISSPTSWESLESMEAHENTKRPASHQRRSKALAALFQARFGTAYGSSVSDVMKIIAILEINAMEVESASRSLQAIYPVACLAEHSCIPTAFRIFGSPEEGFPLTLRAAVDMSRGTPVSLTYTDSLWGTLERRVHLYYSKLFLCDCKRCSDREEMGARLMGLKCGKCGDCVLPDNPLSRGWLRGAKAEAMEKWSCLQCGENANGKRARRAGLQAADAIKELENDDDAEIEEYEKLLESLLIKLYHRNSSVLDLKHSILHLLNPPESLTDNNLTTKEKYAREVLEVATILFPGISQLKGVSYYELASSLMEKLRRQKGNNQNYRQDLREAEETLEKCIYHLRYQSKSQPEYYLFIDATTRLEEIKTMIENMKDV